MYTEQILFTSASLLSSVMHGQGVHRLITREYVIMVLEENWTILGILWHMTRGHIFYGIWQHQDNKIIFYITMTRLFQFYPLPYSVVCVNILVKCIWCQELPWDYNEWFYLTILYDYWLIIAVYTFYVPWTNTCICLKAIASILFHDADKWSMPLKMHLKMA